jgi:hypothetical protein
MTEMAEYHTNSYEYPPEERLVHHDRDCPDGKRILSEHRAASNGGKPLCGDCRRL